MHNAVNQQKYKNYYLFLIGINIFLWLLALSFAQKSFTQISYCLIAYLLGLRHAMDGDHVSAIDNITRKFLAEKRNTRKVGMFFSMGHSSVVLALSILLAMIPKFITTNMSSIGRYGEIVGCFASIFFLTILSVSNVLLCINLIKNKFARSEQKSPTTIIPIAKFYKIVNSNFSVYVVGLLFGLSFDSATEIALISLASSKEIAANFYFVLLLPLLFSAGMCLTDTAVSQFSSTVYKRTVYADKDGVRLNIVLTVLVAFSGIFIAACQLIYFITKRADGFLTNTCIFVPWTAQHLEVIGVVITSVLVVSYLYLSLASKYRGS